MRITLPLLLQLEQVRQQLRCLKSENIGIANTHLFPSRFEDDGYRTIGTFVFFRYLPILFREDEFFTEKYNPQVSLFVRLRFAGDWR